MDYPDTTTTMQTILQKCACPTVRVVNDYMETGFSNFAIKYCIFAKIKKVRKTVFACAYRAMVKTVKQKKYWLKISLDCPFKNIYSQRKKNNLNLFMVLKFSFHKSTQFTGI